MGEHAAPRPPTGMHPVKADDGRVGWVIVPERPASRLISVAPQSHGTHERSRHGTSVK